MVSRNHSVVRNPIDEMSARLSIHRRIERLRIAVAPLETFTYLMPRTTPRVTAELWALPAATLSFFQKRSILTENREHDVEIIESC